MYSSIEEICGQIIVLDSSIRFAGFATDAGKIIAYKYRKKVAPLLTSTETQLSFIDSALMMRIRKDMEPKLGKVICSIVLYEKVTHATVLLNREDYPILMISFDNSNIGTNHESVILDAILPLVYRYFTRT
ncbi:MAG TPA: hypothetical protein VEL11_19145 [Candidatus Bathyarchaeia archaeon]|nr:hypothetical protein [Candidatus Bathyarchaeia archaeon]